MTVWCARSPSTRLCRAPLQTGARRLLLLHDHEDDPLTVANLAEMRLSSAQLAYLSACRTAFMESLELIDEAIYLTSAFQLAGFHHVIGTLWEINDEIASRMAADFYAELGRATSRHGGSTPMRQPVLCITPYARSVTDSQWPLASGLPMCTPGSEKSPDHPGQLVYWVVRLPVAEVSRWTAPDAASRPTNHHGEKEVILDCLEITIMPEHPALHSSRGRLRRQAMSPRCAAHWGCQLRPRPPMRLNPASARLTFGF
ncbi:CHAT domain-containing protein [Streptomyces maoxianensis]|uniref:CHAT domain-containing protein n=1 Tax=Streptomyces maoxianensis TaxID=1459942 RepID=A0ABV9GCH7_9ACTN